MAQQLGLPANSAGLALLCPMAPVALSETHLAMSKPDTPASALACSPIQVWREIAGLSCRLTAMADTAQNKGRRRLMVYTVHTRDGS
ncbi:hypothetical protein P2A44_20955 [Xanthomonas perforans]